MEHSKLPKVNRSRCPGGATIFDLEGEAAKSGRVQMTGVKKHFFLANQQNYPTVA